MILLTKQEEPRTFFIPQDEAQPYVKDSVPEHLKRNLQRRKNDLTRR